MPQAKPGSTKPVLRPDAFQATSCASITTTDQPRRATSRAVVSPARPAPITQTSTSMSLVTGPRAGAATTVSVYQVAAGARPLEELTPSIRPPRPPPHARSHARLTATGNRCQESDQERRHEARHAIDDLPTRQGREKRARDARPRPAAGAARPQGGPADGRLHGAPQARAPSRTGIAVAPHPRDLGRPRRRAARQHPGVLRGPPV